MTEQHTVSGTTQSSSVGSIQPGWTVYGSDGSEMGSVVEVGPESISVKKKGILGGTVTVARALVAESEEGRVDLNVPAGEAGQR
jgi:hypothetical protein